MRRLRQWLIRLTTSMTQRHDDGRVREEIDDYVAFETEANLRRGLPPAEARRRALLTFGSVESFKERYRDRQGVPAIEHLLQDARLALRRMRKTPGFAVAAIATLALGIGATTAIFSIFNTLVLRPLPVRDPATLFQVLHRGDTGTAESSTYALYEHLKSQAQTIGGTFQVDPTRTLRVVVDGQADAIVGQRVTSDFFDVLGVRAVIGTVIESRGDGGPTPNRGVVLGHAYWTRRFGRDPGVLGKTMTVDGVPHTIVGVTPPEFFGLQVGRRADVTIALDGSDEPTFWKSRALVVRLAPGVSRATATADLNVAFQQYISSDRTLSDRARAQRFKVLELTPASSGLSEFRDRYGTQVRAMLELSVCFS